MDNEEHNAATDAGSIASEHVAAKGKAENQKPTDVRSRMNRDWAGTHVRPSAKSEIACAVQSRQELGAEKDPTEKPPTALPTCAAENAADHFARWSDI